MDFLPTALSAVFCNRSFSSCASNSTSQLVDSKTQEHSSTVPAAHTITLVNTTAANHRSYAPAFPLSSETAAKGTDIVSAIGGISQERPHLTLPRTSSQGNPQISTSSSLSPFSSVAAAAPAPSSPHSRADPRIIVPVVLTVVALIMAGVAIWIKRIKRRRVAVRLGIIEPNPGVDEEIRIHSGERAGKQINDFEDPFVPGTVRERSKIPQTAIQISEAIKTRLETGERKSSQKGQIEGINYSEQGGGYGWGLGKRGERLSGQVGQGYAADPVPVYSRYSSRS